MRRAAPGSPRARTTRATRRWAVSPAGPCSAGRGRRDRRRWRGWASQQDLQRAAQRCLGPGQLRGQLQQGRRGRAAAAQPATQGLVAEFGSLVAGEPEGVGDAPLGAVETDRAPGTEVDLLAAEVEGGGVEVMP